MNIKINGEIIQIQDKIKLTDFVIMRLNKKELRGIAVAVNNIIVPKSKWNETFVNENDNIEIVHAVQGG